MFVILSEVEVSLLMALLRIRFQKKEGAYCYFLDYRFI